MDRYSKSNKRNALKEEYTKVCGLCMEAHDKAKEIVLKLNSTTNSKEIIELKKELKKYRYRIDTYEKQRESIYNMLNVKLHTEIPLLLFAINESRYSYSGKFEPSWEYVYYYADHDEIVKTTKLGTLQLKKNDVNLTDLFLDLGMPEELRGTNIGNDYDEIIGKAVNITKILINQIFEDNDIASWDDVSTRLKKYAEMKTKIDEVKGIKHLKLV